MRKFKTIFKDNLRELLSMVGIGFSFLLLLHSLWQLDLIAVRPVWSTHEWITWFLGIGYKDFSEMPFQCGFWFKTNVGMAYDFYLSLAVVSWFLLLISMYLWRWRTVKKLKKEYDELYNDYRHAVSCIEDENIAEQF